VGFQRELYSNPNERVCCVTGYGLWSRKAVPFRKNTPGNPDGDFAFHLALETRKNNIIDVDGISCVNVCVRYVR